MYGEEKTTYLFILLKIADSCDKFACKSQRQSIQQDKEENAGTTRKGRPLTIILPDFGDSPICQRQQVHLATATGRHVGCHRSTIRVLGWQPRTWLLASNSAPDIMILASHCKTSAKKRAEARGMQTGVLLLSFTDAIHDWLVENQAVGIVEETILNPA